MVAFLHPLYSAEFNQDQLCRICLKGDACLSFCSATVIASKMYTAKHCWVNDLSEIKIICGKDKTNHRQVKVKFPTQEAKLIKKNRDLDDDFQLIDELASEDKAIIEMTNNLKIQSQKINIILPRNKKHFLSFFEETNITRIYQDKVYLKQHVYQRNDFTNKALKKNLTCYYHGTSSVPVFSTKVSKIKKLPMSQKYEYHEGKGNYLAIDEISDAYQDLSILNPGDSGGSLCCLDSSNSNECVLIGINSLNIPIWSTIY